MLIELTLATAMVTATALIHGAGLIFLGRLLRLERRSEISGHMHPTSFAELGLLLLPILALTALHGIEIWLYAAVYLAIGAIGELREAVYFSTITYGAIGYSDEAIADQWRLVSAIEGINGILMIGWSTAFLIRVVGLLRRA